MENSCLEIVIATKNEGKIKEIKEIIALDGVRFLTFQDFDEWPKVEETGLTFEENALIKAKALLKWTRTATLADDSGLEVDTLGGEPGIMSARYAGPHCSTLDNNLKLLNKLEGVPLHRRIAHFRCSAVLAGTDGSLLVSEGTCRGHIVLEPRGSGGFGYDPLFVPDGYNKTIAELPAEEKNKISHRGKAFGDLKEKIEKMIAAH